MDTLPEKNSPFWQELIKLVLLSLVIVVPFRLYVAQPFVVDGLSMYPTFHNADYLIVDELSYRFHDPARGDVIVFHYPLDPGKSFLKRIVGLPGEIVSMKDGRVTIISSEHPDGLSVDEPYIEMPKIDTLNYTLGQGEYFVMGDNRAQSADSRLWGPVPRGNIIGRPIIRAWPPTLWPGSLAHFQTAKTN